MRCPCHDEPMLWKNDPTCRAGGHWTCRVRKREIDREWQRRRYDADPVFRIEKNLHDHARRRRLTLERRRALLQKTEGD